MGRRDISIPSVEVILSCGKENKRSYDITVFGDTENSAAYCPEPTLKLALLFELDDNQRSLPDLRESVILELHGNYFRVQNM